MSIFIFIVLIIVLHGNALCNEFYLFGDFCFPNKFPDCLQLKILKISDTEHFKIIIYLFVELFTSFLICICKNSTRVKTQRRGKCFISQRICKDGNCSISQQTSNSFYDRHLLRKQS